MISSQLALLLIAFVPAPQESQSYSILQRTDEPVQYSILVRTDEPESKEPAAAQNKPESTQQKKPQFTQRPTIKSPASSPINFEPGSRVAQLPDELRFRSPNPPRGSAGNRVDNSASIVVKPMQKDFVAVALTGPDLVNRGTLQTYTIKVTNSSDVDSAPVEVQLGTPDGIEFADSTIQGLLNRDKNLVTWKFEKVSAQDSIEIHFRTRGRGVGPQLMQLVVVEENKMLRHATHQTFIHASNSQNAGTRTVQTPSDRMQNYGAISRLPGFRRSTGNRP